MTPSTPAAADGFPAFTRPEWRALIDRIQAASRQARAALDVFPIDADALAQALAEGADVSDLSLGPSQPTNPMHTWRVWQDVGKSADAAALRHVLDAYRPQTDEPGFLGCLVDVLAHHGSPEALQTVLNRCPGVTASTTSLRNGLVRGSDAIADVLLDAAHLMTPNDASSLLHLVCTPHALQRLLALGADPNVPHRHPHHPSVLRRWLLSERPDAPRGDAPRGTGWLPPKTMTPDGAVAARAEAVALLLAHGARLGPNEVPELPTDWMWRAVLTEKWEPVGRVLLHAGVPCPENAYASSPALTLEAERQHLGVDWAGRGAALLTRWLTEKNSGELDVLALGFLRNAGVSLDDPLPETGFSPVLTALRHERLDSARVLLEAGARGETSPTVQRLEHDHLVSEPADLYQVLMNAADKKFLIEWARSEAVTAVGQSQLLQMALEAETLRPLSIRRLRF